MGNVGIGTTAPSSRLTIAAGATNGEFAIGNFNAKVVDDMEDVSDWSSSDGTYTPISLESTNVKVGNYALKISTTVSNSNGDTVTKTFSPTENWTSYGKLGFWIKASYTTTSTDATTSTNNFGSIPRHWRKHPNTRHYNSKNSTNGNTKNGTFREWLLEIEMLCRLDQI